MYKIPDLKKIFSHKSPNSYRLFRVMRPNHDWKIIVSIFIFLTLLLIAFGFYFLNRIKNEDIFKVEKLNEIKPSLIKQDLLEKILNEFNSKSQKLNNFPKKDIFITDPSK